MAEPGYIGGVPVELAPAAQRKSRSSTVLVVDDERMIRVAVRHTLEKHGYQVVEAANGGAAIQLIRNREVLIDLVVTDLVMPEMNGVELIAQISAAKISLPVIYISGYVTDTAVRKVTGARNLWMLAKPFFPATLMSAVQGALAEPGQQ